MGLFDKLGFGLKKTKDGIFNSITKTIISSPLTDELYDELLEQLILADVGYEVSEYLCEELRKEARKRKAKSGEDIIDFVIELKMPSFVFLRPNPSLSNNPIIFDLAN